MKTREKALLSDEKYCAHLQLKGSRCLTHNLCAIFIGFTQHNNCAIAIVNTKKSLSSKLLLFSSCTTEHYFAMQTRKITEITENKQRDLQLIHSCDVTCNHSIGSLCRFILETRLSFLDLVTK